MPDIEVTASQPGGVLPPVTAAATATTTVGQDARERKEERRRERRARRERRLRQRQAELANQFDAYMYEGGTAADLCAPPPPYATLPPQGNMSYQPPPAVGGRDQAGAPGAGGAPQRGGWRSSIPSFSRRFVNYFFILIILDFLSNPFKFDFFSCTKLNICKVMNLSF